MTTIPLASPSLATSSDLPEGVGRAILVFPGRIERRVAFLFGLAPCGVLPATRVATGAVRSYRTFSPLPVRGTGALEYVLRGSRPPYRRYVFCATVLQVTLTGRYPAHCPAAVGLSSRLRPPG